jgi:L-iditol 2-dehydrogenase
MKALVLEEYNKLVYKEVPKPVPGSEDVLVRVKACSICGSDVHGYDGSSGRRIPPIIMGHEASGVIEAVGEEVVGYQPGDRVTFDSTLYCGKCWYCRRGESNLCDNRMVLGVSCAEYSNPGAMAEYVKVPYHILYKLPDEVSFAQAALLEPLSVVVHAVKLAALGLGDTVLIVGAGTIGQLLLQTILAAGSTAVIVADIDEQKLLAAKKLGAGWTVNTRNEDTRQVVDALTGGRGVDIAFEAVGIDPAFQTAVRALRRGGTLVLVGNVSKEVHLPLQYAVTSEIRMLGSCASSGEYEICLELIARGKVDVDSLISVVAPLAEGARWFEQLHRAAPGITKVMLEP